MKDTSYRRIGVDVFFDYAHYVLAGALAGVVIGGIIAPAFHLSQKESVEILGATIGGISVFLMKALRLV